MFLQQYVPHVSTSSKFVGDTVLRKQSFLIGSRQSCQFVLDKTSTGHSLDWRFLICVTVCECSFTESERKKKLAPKSARTTSISTGHPWQEASLLLNSHVRNGRSWNTSWRARGHRHQPSHLRCSWGILCCTYKYKAPVIHRVPAGQPNSLYM